MAAFPLFLDSSLLRQLRNLEVLSRGTSLAVVDHSRLTAANVDILSCVLFQFRASLSRIEGWSRGGRMRYQYWVANGNATKHQSWMSLACYWTAGTGTQRGRDWTRRSCVRTTVKGKNDIWSRVGKNYKRVQIWPAYIPYRFSIESTRIAHVEYSSMSNTHTLSIAQWVILTSSLAQWVFLTASIAQYLRPWFQTPDFSSWQYLKVWAVLGCTWLLAV